MLQGKSGNDFINILIVAVLGIGLIIALIEVGVAYMTKGTFPNELIMFAGGISAGFVGYLSREYKQPPGQTPTVNAGPSGTVNVTNEAETEEDKK
jgi:hypothetical protein